MPDLDPTRDQRITASIVPWLVLGDPDKLQEIFLRLTADDRRKPDKFSQSWPARYGLAVEKLARGWIQEHGFELTDIGVQYFHRERDYVSSTLDSRIISRHGVRCNCVQDVKCINAYRDIDDAVDFYRPQCIVQRACAAAETASLLIVKGGNEPQEVDVTIDPGFEQEVWRVIDRFWNCVTSLTPPVPLRFPRIVAPSEWRRIDLDHDDSLPNWSGEMRELLTAWDATHLSAQSHEKTKQQIKALIAEDIGEVVYDRFSVKRNRGNALSIKYRKRS